MKSGQRIKNKMAKRFRAKQFKAFFKSVGSFSSVGQFKKL